MLHARRRLCEAACVCLASFHAPVYIPAHCGLRSALSHACAALATPPSVSALVVAQRPADTKAPTQHFTHSARTPEALQVHALQPSPADSHTLRCVETLHLTQGSLGPAMAADPSAAAPPPAEGAPAVAGSKAEATHAPSEAPALVVNDAGKETPVVKLADVTFDPATLCAQMVALRKHTHDVPGRLFVDTCAQIAALIGKCGTAFGMASADIAEVRRLLQPLPPASTRCPSAACLRMPGLSACKPWPPPTNHILLCTESGSAHPPLQRVGGEC